VNITGRAKDLIPCLESRIPPKHFLATERFLSLMTLVLKRLLPTIYLPAGYSQQSGLGTKYQLNAAASYTVLNGLATGSWGIDVLFFMYL